MRKPKNRADLKFEPSNCPEPVEFDYSGDITDVDLAKLETAMPDAAKNNKGIIISGDKW